MFSEAALSRAVSCEFHYKQSVNRKSTKLNGANKVCFKKLAYALLEANTVSVFEKKWAEMNRFIKENPVERYILSRGLNGGITERPTNSEHSRIR